MANGLDRTIGRKKAIVSPGTRERTGGTLPHVNNSPAQAAPEKLVSLSKLSHDIRTQLYIIIGFAELMLMEIPGKINEEQRRNLKDVLDSGRRLQNLLQDIVTRSGDK
jgi:protein-histidine pros-kinase